MTAEELMRRARRKDRSFSEDRHPPTVLRDELSRKMRELAGDIPVWELHALVSTLVIELPIDPFEEGAPLEVETDLDEFEPLDYLRIIETRAVWKNGRGHDPIEQVSPRAQHTLQPYPVVWISGGRLFPGGAPSTWAPYGSIEVQYVPAPARLVDTEEADGEDIAFPFPAGAWDVLADQLAAYMARRAPAEMQSDPAALELIAAASRDRFLRELGDRQAATVSRVREVW